MGNFWDILGDGYAVKGAGKKLQLWQMKYKFQNYPQDDRRYKFYPLWKKTRNPDDIGFYLISVNTGYYIKYETKEVVSRLSMNVSPRQAIMPKHMEYKPPKKKIEQLITARRVSVYRDRSFH